MKTISSLRLPLMLAVLLLVGVGQVSAATYTAKTPHFKFEVPEKNKAAISNLVKNAEATRTRFCKFTPTCFTEQITIRVSADDKAFLKAQPGASHIDWARGIAYTSRNLVLLRLDKDNILTLDETFEHEISHIVLLKAAKKRPPIWFIEGLAIYQAKQDLISRFEAAAGAAVGGNLIPFSKLTRSFPSGSAARSLAYAQSGLFMHFLINELGEEAIGKIISAMASGSSFSSAFVMTAGHSVDYFEDSWMESFDGFLPLLLSLRSNWWLWTFMTLLFLVAVAVKLTKVRRRKREMAKEEELDWEYVGKRLDD
jgi:Peptidase MA superfamily